MKPGDIVMWSFAEVTGHGIVVETGLNMWGEEVVPSGVKVMWCSGEIDTVYEDEVTISDELSDDQLEQVRGGMKKEAFDYWRVNMINKMEIK